MKEKTQPSDLEAKVDRIGRTLAEVVNMVVDLSTSVRAIEAKMRNHAIN